MKDNFKIVCCTNKNGKIMDTNQLIKLLSQKKIHCHNKIVTKTLKPVSIFIEK